MILFICDNDWANLSHQMANALRSVGVNCVDVKTVKHKFNYSSESDVKTVKQITYLIRNADKIVIFHSCLNSLREVAMSKMHTCKVFVFHAGSFYRKRYRYCNKVFNEVVEGTFTNHCEFFKLGAKNINYIERCIDVDYPFPAFRHKVNSPIKIAHYPSNHEIKGTDNIISMMKNIDSDFVFSKELVDFESNMKRVSDCDVYVEMFKPKINDDEYGHYGCAALEAAACGKIVITQNLNNNVYEAVYGKSQFLLVKNESEFVKTIKSLKQLDISQVQTDTYNWVRKNHNYTATGNRLKKLLCVQQ